MQFSVVNLKPFPIFGYAFKLIQSKLHIFGIVHVLNVLFLQKNFIPIVEFCQFIRVKGSWVVEVKLIKEILHPLILYYFISSINVTLLYFISKP